jgi:uncharacterized protein YndB with AHSA1/START domain
MTYTDAGQRLGQLQHLADGRWRLTFERRLLHPPDQVWRALTDVNQLRTWFVQILDYDRSRLHFAEGQTLAFVPLAEHPDLPTGHGRVLEADPPRALEYTWDRETLRWELEADGPHACRLRFINTLDDEDTARAVASGWHAALDLLAAQLST